MLRSIKARLQRIERLLPGSIKVLLDAGTTATLPPRAGIALLVGVLAEGRTGITPAIVAKHADVIDRIAPVQGSGDKGGSLLPLIRVLREGIREQREEHRDCEETT